MGEILHAVDRSQLILKSRGLSSSDVRNWVSDALERRGIGRSRWELLAPTSTRREHLATYARVDVALDPFPYNGVTTTCEALFMGVPVVALAGSRCAGRMGASILTAVGLSDWIARDEPEYTARAVRAASERAQLRTLRASLRDRLRASPLFEGRRVALRIEDAVRVGLERKRGRVK